MKTDAETRAYNRGYNAGRRRRAADNRDDRRWQEREAFRRRAFLAALPSCLTVDNWKMDDKPVVNSSQRIELAERIANQAAKRFFG